MIAIFGTPIRTEPGWPRAAYPRAGSRVPTKPYAWRLADGLGNQASYGAGLLPWSICQAAITGCHRLAVDVIVVISSTAAPTLVTILNLAATAE